MPAQQGRGQTGRSKLLTPAVTRIPLAPCRCATLLCDAQPVYGHAAPTDIYGAAGCRFDQPFDPASLDDARRVFAERGHEIAAVILEPVVQGAGGMWFYHPEYLRGLRNCAARLARC